MKIRNPKSRFDLRIKGGDFVLDIGGGDNPHPRANVVVDKFLFDNTHRSHSLRLLKRQNLIVADGEKLPFKDNVFDYVVCSHTIEHVAKPFKFLKELSRVGKRGYIETPSLIGEYLIPKKAHRWVTLELNKRLVLMEKQAIDLTPSIDFGDLLQKHLAPNSLEFQILMRTYPDLFTVRYEWAEQIDFVVNPQNPELRSLFTTSWTKEEIATIFNVRRSRGAQVLSFLEGLASIISDFMRRRFLF